MKTKLTVGCIVILSCILLGMSSFCMATTTEGGEDLKIMQYERDILVERVMRLKTQIQLMQYQFNDLQTLLNQEQDKLRKLDTEIRELPRPPAPKVGK